MKKSLLILSAIALVACGTSKVSTNSINADVARGALKYPGYTAAEFTAGKTANENYCGSCHALKSASSKTEAQWNTIVPNMVKRANRKAGGVAIDAKTQESILKYLVTMSSVPATMSKAN
ncbi:hypothetical protein [Solitalea koreensis]|uniref:Cytochrome c domain-containing protein n=1 Tax=Solitalea koreensis TaxID=543615 RepID=A0A521EI26_9SPHI|nr:hypothetical protein [Solitalea koreensis]SMO83577.1 hypothetical protein SAMN06265350_11517 [Solitalea koreensis]